MEAPVMYEAFADATKAITWAISSGVASRLIGTVESSAALFSAVLVKRVSMPVSVVPTAITFTRTPVPATSSAADNCTSQFRRFTIQTCFMQSVYRIGQGFEAFDFFRARKRGVYRQEFSTPSGRASFQRTPA